MRRPLTELGKALETRRNRAGLTKVEVAARMTPTGTRSPWDRAITQKRPTVHLVRKAAAAVGMNTDEALRLAGYDPQLVAEADATRAQQPEQQQQAELLAG